jgi:membrane protease YdiL (CAAX protease family)
VAAVKAGDPKRVVGASGPLVAGWLVLRGWRHPAAIAWAGVLPVAVVLIWPWVLGSDVPVGDPACRDPLALIALHRVAVAAAGLAMVTGLAVAHRSGWSELGLRRPTRFEAASTVGGGVALVAAGLFIGPTIARPFFGELDFPVPAAALIPAALFGIANGVLEEVLYRGAMQAWLARTLPMAVAIAIQGVTFGIVHVGPEVVDLVPVHVALLTSVGVAAGLARWRFGSLWIPIGVHIGADIALYVGLACRTPA